MCINEVAPINYHQHLKTYTLVAWEDITNGRK